METPSSFRAKFRKSFENSTSEMITAARPMTMAPRPMFTSTKPW